MKKVRYISGHRNDLIHGKIYDVIDYNIYPNKIHIFIENERGKEEWFLLDGFLTLFEDVTIEYRDVLIDEILY